MSRIPEFTNYYRCCRCYSEWEDEGSAGRTSYCTGCGHFCYPLRTEKAPLFCNHYQCWACGYRWEDEWTSGCDDECPKCEARDCAPVRIVALNITARKLAQEGSI